MIFHPPLSSDDLGKNALVVRVHFPGLPEGKIRAEEAIITDATDLVHTQFGYTMGALKNALLSILVPTESLPAHAGHLARFWKEPLAAKTRPMGEGVAKIKGKHISGSTFPITIGLRPFISGGEAYADANIGIVANP